MRASARTRAAARMRITETLMYAFKIVYGTNLGTYIRSYADTCKNNTSLSNKRLLLRSDLTILMTLKKVSSD